MNKSRFLMLTAISTVLNASGDASWSSTISNSYSNAKEYVSGKLSSSPKNRVERYNLVWKDSLGKFKEASDLELKLESAPEPSWRVWKTNKNDIKADIDDTINDIIDDIADIDLLDYKRRVKKYRDKIKAIKYDIAKIREDRITASKDEKGKYSSKIAELKDDIKSVEKEIKEIHKELKRKFRENRVELSAKQIDVLLDRVDGDDIIQMTVVLDVLKYINKQIATLVKESGEDLDTAKKYYAMHLVSLQIVVNIQQKYIDKVNNVYLPKLKSIEEKTLKVKSETEINIDKEQNERRRQIYISNLKSQELTLKVLRLYKEHLNRAIANVLKAKSISKKNLDLAENTLKTVLLSSDLYNTIAESRGLFNRVISIQIPNIVEFENLKIKKEFKNLTLQLSQ